MPRAIDQFTHRVIRETGALTACLGGLDLIAFSGGIGENDARLARTSGDAWRGRAFLLTRSAAARPMASTRAVHAPDSRIEIWVIPTDEGRVAAREAAALLREDCAVAA